MSNTPDSSPLQAPYSSAAGAAAPAFPSRSPLVLGALWLLMAVSSFVNMEPAPFDLLALGLCVLFFLLGLKVPSSLNAPLLIVAVVLLANVTSIIFAPSESARSIPGMLIYAGLTAYLFVVWLMLASVVTTDANYALRTIWNGWLIAAVIAVCLGLVGYFRLLPGYEAFVMAGRAKATFKDANVYAPFLIPVALYVLARIHAKQPAANLLRLVLFAFLMTGLLIGFSRGAWGNFVVSFLVFSALAFVNARTLQSFSRLIVTGVAVLILGAGILVAAYLTPQLEEMLEARASLLHDYDTAAGGRFSTQRAALTEIARNPLGIGPDRSYAELGQEPHNVFLKVAVENGWVGGIAFVAFVGLTLWKGFFFAFQPGPLQKEFSVVFASLVGIVAESFLIDTLHWRHLFVVLAIAWGMMAAGQQQAHR